MPDHENPLPPIAGSVNVTLGDVTVAPPGPPHSYLGVAENLMAGVRVLAAADPPPAVALAFLAAHVLECALKAFLSRDGTETKTKNRDTWHNPGALWREAGAAGLPVSPDPPSWAEQLSRLHDRPFRLRYAGDVHGILTPAAEPMASELAGLVALVRDNLD
jgi:hypothetical protein